MINDMLKKFILAVMFVCAIAICYGKNDTAVSVKVDADLPTMHVISDTAIMYKYAYMIQLTAPESVHSVIVKIPSRYEFKHGEKTDTVATFDGSFAFPTNTFSTYVLYTSKPVNQAYFRDGDCSMH